METFPEPTFENGLYTYRFHKLFFIRGLVAKFLLILSIMVLVLCLTIFIIDVSSLGIFHMHDWVGKCIGLLIAIGWIIFLIDQIMPNIMVIGTIRKTWLHSRISYKRNGPTNKTVYSVELLSGEIYQVPFLVFAATQEGDRVDFLISPVFGMIHAATITKKSKLFDHQLTKANEERMLSLAKLHTTKSKAFLLSALIVAALSLLLGIAAILSSHIQISINFPWPW